MEAFGSDPLSLGTSLVGTSTSRDNKRRKFENLSGHAGICHFISLFICLFVKFSFCYAD